VAKNLDDLKASLFATQDGGDACHAINKLAKHTKKGDGQAKKVLAEYVCNGPINHIRDYACAVLARAVAVADVELAAVFRRGLSDPHTRYWSILGYVNSAGKSAYKELTKIAKDKSIPVEDRSHAVKCLATFSKQPFDRQLPADPGGWKETDLRLSEVMAWAKGGYPDGQGYSEPRRHPALDEPKTDFEKIVSRLDKKLAKKRQDRQDLADPTAWLAVAAPADIQRIKARWDLPSIYLDFLTRFSPIKVIIESRRFFNGGLLLFGASDLIEGQNGYSFNSIEGRPIEDWPEHLVVFAYHAGDPFVLDLAKSDGKDAPVDTAEHGAGAWAFSRIADSFCGFLETLAK
jgi:hypothetical protein